MSGSSVELIHVRDGLVVPLPALLALLTLERAGHSIRLAGDDIVVERGAGSPPMDAEALAALRRWKRHAWLIVRNLLRDDVAPFTPQPEASGHSTERYDQ